MKNWILNSIIGAFCIGIIVVIIVFATKELTANESTLISVLLSIISIIATWIVSQYFAKEGLKSAIEEVRKEHQSNLRTYALNAAEKVDNLSNELTKLAVYMELELEKDNDNSEVALLSKVERLESSIHIIKTLKSVNDTSLSDWKGVIGEELEERQEEKEERENRILLLTERIDELINSNNKSNNTTSKDVEVKELKNQLNVLLASINKPYLKRSVSNKAQKEKIEKNCLKCENPIVYQQRKNKNSFKTVKCNNCESRYLARYGENEGFYLVPEEMIEENINCPWCSEINEVKFSNLPFTKGIVECNSCQNSIKLTRGTHQKLSAKTYGNQITDKEILITKELIERIETLLPEQPWKTSIHKEIALQLNIPNKTVSKVIKKLIDEGKFFPQIDGIIYKPEKEGE